LHELLERPGECITEDTGLQEAADWARLYEALKRPRETKRQRKERLAR
jgi:hypothetical protein